VVRDGKVVYQHAYGLASLEHEAPIRTDTPFAVASLSKQFTAFAILLLAQEGKLSLDDDVRKYVPELHDFGARITLRDLLHHTSGLRDQWELLVAAGWRLEDVITQGDVLRLAFAQRELNFPPGDRYLYCNTDYTLLGLVVRRVSGESLREFCRERVFGPLGMRHTLFRDDLREVVKGMAQAYQPKGTSYESTPGNCEAVGATGLVTTVEDLALWEANLLDPKVGGAWVRDELFRRGRLAGGAEIDYACGLQHGSYRGLPTLGHEGADAGYRSVYLRFAEQRLAIVVLANLSSLDPARLARSVADLYLAGEPREAPGAPATGVALAREPEPKLLTQVCGDYEPEPGAFVTLSERGGRLCCRLPSGAVEEAQPMPGGEFYLPDRRQTVSFTRDTDGKVEALRLIGDGGELVMPRVERWHPTNGDLKECQGTFYSAELEVRYYVVLRDGVLVAEGPRTRYPLAPTSRDRFGSSLGWLTFTRDAQGRVTGMVLDCVRSRHLRFTQEATPTG
jgi:CubicO group peptidase (beta-lactamase class C family)